MREKMSIQKMVVLATVAILFLVFLFTAGKIVEVVDSSEIVVIQSAIDGKLKVVTQPGPVMQNYGTATHYKRRSQFWFSKHANEGDTSDQSIKIRFNDGGHADLSGSVSFYMPLNDDAVIKIHKDFQNADNLEKQLIKQVVTKSVYMTGPLMSSKESTSEKRTDLLSYIEDQAVNGVYKTTQDEVKVHDELSNTDKTTTVVKIVTDKDGKATRQEQSPISQYNIVLSNLTINSINYDDQVENQIKEQQKTTMMIQTAIANSKKAEQDAITTELQGKAGAAKSKWDQEIIKAQVVTEAQQQMEVAKLEAQTAILEAQKQKTKADADYYTNQKLVSAGLTPQQRAEYKMKTDIGVAEAIAKITLPTTYMSGNSSGNGSASMLETILGVKLLNTDNSK